jgi:uncharacterized protein
MLVPIWYVHYFIYYSLTRYIDISARENIWLAVILAILSVSFLISTVCASYWDNRKTRYAYYLSSIWLGILYYLTISFAAIWVIAFVAEWAGLYVSLPFLGTLGIAFTAVVSTYGLYNARIIRMTRVDVDIRDLPDSWDGKRIAHISDVHVGHILRSSFVRRIVKRVNAEKVEMLCITGDLFDGMDGRLEHLLDPLQDIQTTHGIYYADGNHETYLGVDRAFRALGHTPTHILRDEIVTIDGLDIIGIDYPETGVKKDIAKAITELDGYKKENPSILLYHTPYQIDAISKTGVNLELCGHTHRGQLWPNSWITHFIFRGHDYGLSRIGDYSLYTSSGVGTWWPPMRVGTKSEIAIITLHKKA